MQGPAHLVLSWFTAESCGFEEPRSRRIIGLPGLSPDFDVIAYVGAYVYFGFDRNRAYEEVWKTVHHHYTHGFTFAVLVGILAWFWARSAPRTRAGPHDGALNVALLAFVAVLLHVFFDVLAAGARFPVFPYWPISDFAWTVSWSWELKDWPNQIVTLGCLAAIIVYAKLAGRSPLEALNYRLDAWVVNIAQQGSDSKGPTDTRTTLGLQRGAWLRIIIYLLLLVVCAVVVIPVADDIF